MVNCIRVPLLINLILLGLLHLKQRQDQELPPEEVYIQYAAEVLSLGSIIHEEDDDMNGAGGDPIRVIICMNKESSKRLLDAQFLQSDIGFKRIVGFQEFELGGRDHNSRTGVSIFHLLFKCLIYFSSTCLCSGLSQPPNSSCPPFHFQKD